MDGWSSLSGSHGKGEAFGFLKPQDFIAEAEGVIDNPVEFTAALGSAPLPRGSECARIVHLIRFNSTMSI